VSDAQDVLKKIAAQLEKGDAPGVKALTEEAVALDVSAEDILNNGLVSGMNVVGTKFKNNEFFIPEVLIAARAMKAGMEIIKPLLAEAKVKSRGKVIIGTVKGDLHDIGKNIVSMMLEGAGFDVVNLGTDMTVEKIMEQMNKEKPDVLGMSALLTTTMVYMRDVIESLEKAGLKNSVKVIIGGAPITQSYANEIRADGYAPDAASAVDLVKGLLGIQN
jgi:5-methyltetrahydrofolate--homocysteine methyltransferase